MNHEPLVSIIVPSYNHEKFIVDTIESLLNQTYGNFEIIVLDDGSDDDSLKIIKNFEDKKNFFYSSQKNQGICKTLNRAIKEFSKGEYISLIASDDIWHLSKLELQVKKILKSPLSELCYSQAIKFSQGEKMERGSIIPSNPLQGRILDKVFIRQHVPAGTILFSRKIYDDLDGFDETLLEEDWDFIIRCASKTEFSIVKKPLLFYRQHKNNIMKMRSRKKIFQEKKKILKKNRKLVRLHIFLFSISIHFLYDMFLYKIFSFFKES